MTQETKNFFKVGTFYFEISPDMQMVFAKVVGFALIPGCNESDIQPFHNAKVVVLQQPEDHQIKIRSYNKAQEEHIKELFEKYWGSYVRACIKKGGTKP